MYLVLLLAAAALLGDTCKSANVNKHLKLIAEMENHIDANGIPSKSSNKRFVTITESPNDTYTHIPGTTIALTCVALGSPAPSVHWFKNDAPVYEYDTESPSSSSLGEVSSTLLVRRAGARDAYSCRAAAAGRAQRATTVIYGSDGSGELSERGRLYPLAPRILLSYKVYLDVIGTEAVLPCRAAGHPRPRVTWRDNRGVLVKNNRRMKVLRSGALVISALRWADMGGYSCRAENVFGAHTANTFVYPAKAG